MERVGLESLCESFSNYLILILDTSVLMNIGAGRPSIENLCEATGMWPILLIPMSVYEELKGLASVTSKPSVSIKAKTALKILNVLSTCRVVLLEARFNPRTDDDILSIAKKILLKGCKTAVATSDRELRNRCRLHGIPTVFLRRSQLRFQSDYEF